MSAICIVNTAYIDMDYIIQIHKLELLVFDMDLG